MKNRKSKTLETHNLDEQTDPQNFNSSVFNESEAPIIDESVRSGGKDSDKEIIKIYDHDISRGSNLNKIKSRSVSCQKFRVQLDPSYLHDINMYGGKDRVETSVIRYELMPPQTPEKNESDPDAIMDDQDVVMEGQDEQMMEVDIVSDSATKFKFVKENLHPIGINEKDLVELDPRYAKFLEDIVRAEFYKLQDEIDETDKDRISKNKKKKYINFLHILTKRLKKYISSRKTKLYLDNIMASSNIIKIDTKKALEADIFPEKPKALSSKLVLSRKVTPKPTPLQPLETGATTASPLKMKKQNSRRRLAKITSFIKGAELHKVSEEANEESEEVQSQKMQVDDAMRASIQEEAKDAAIETAELSDKRDGPSPKSVSSTEQKESNIIKIPEEP